MRASMDRRVFLKRCVAAGVVGTGLLLPRRAWAAWPQKAFADRALSEAMMDLLGSTDAATSNAVEVAAPATVENGAVVPVTASTTLDSVQSLSLFAEGNFHPLLAHVVLTASAVPYYSTQVRLARTGNVIAVVKANGKLYQARTQVKVTVGGDGG